MNPNSHVAAAVAISSTSQVSSDVAMEPNGRTELDSHSNMVVVSRHAYILNSSGRTAQVSPLTPEYELLKEVPIIDAAVEYDCPITDKSFILVFHNALSVLLMDHNCCSLCHKSTRNTR